MYEDNTYPQKKKKDNTCLLRMYECAYLLALIIPSAPNSRRSLSAPRSSASTAGETPTPTMGPPWREDAGEGQKETQAAADMAGCVYMYTWHATGACSCRPWLSYMFCCERVCAPSPASIYTRPRARRRRLNLTSGAPTHARTHAGRCQVGTPRRCRCCRCVRLRCMYEAGYALLPPFGSTPTNHARTHARPGVNAPSNQVTVG